MNTKGHHSIAKDAGLPLIREAFGEISPNARLGAFYLGNWLTDVRQLYDPLAVGDARDEIPVLMQKAFDFSVNYVQNLRKKNSTLLGLYDLVASESIETKLASAKVDLINKSKALIDSFLEVQADGKTRYYRMFHDGVLIKGYLKFVHPEKPGDPLQMDLDAFLELFEERFTQYWPHEHMDRPEIRPKPPNTLKRFDDRKNTLPDSRSGLYDYIQEYTRYVAGQLTKIDRDWAKEYLLLNESNPNLDRNLAWNRGLADLGYALHIVEDFFAHSNFVEHAALVMGEKYMPRKYEFTRYRFLKRLKRYNYLGMPEDWTKLDQEDYVVSGYFDFRDTVVSLSHNLDHFILGKLDIDPKDHTRIPRMVYDAAFDVEGTDEKIIEDANKITTDLLELLSDPRKITEEDSENIVLNKVKWFLTTFPPFDTISDQVEGMNTLVTKLTQPVPDYQAIRPLLSHMPVFSDIQALSPDYITPQNVEKLFLATMAFWRGMVIQYQFERIGPNFRASLYEILKTLVYFENNPVMWVRKQILAPYLVDKFLDYSTYFAKEMLYDAIAADRVGCHSLMSKDHADETEIYKATMDCAKAAHYQIVKAMMRWSLPKYKSTTRLPDKEWVDWHEFVQRFIHHPTVGLVCPRVRQVPVGTIHVIQPSENGRPLSKLLEDLAARYLPLTYKPTGLPFTDKTILHGNYSTRFKINPVPVLEQTFAQVVAPSLVPLLTIRRLVIPHLKLNVAEFDPTKVSPQRWYMPVMMHGWTTTRSVELEPTYKFYASEQVAIQKITEWQALRQVLESRYQP